MVIIRYILCRYIIIKNDNLQHDHLAVTTDNKAVLGTPRVSSVYAFPCGTPGLVVTNTRSPQYLLRGQRTRPGRERPPLGAAWSRVCLTLPDAKAGDTARQEILRPQRQTAVAAYFSSEQLLLFVFGVALLMAAVEALIISHYRSQLTKRLEAVEPNVYTDLQRQKAVSAYL